ncbi:galactose/methyl galactoside ABC transporter ATP-binding protein MglA [Candidatus Epulonipiscium fishelsonii]|uniref:Galactose/methyl galactoside ABC transporter ATP-binding protein MglA n=1 Tax=Candidatus Epulonipiscium fishelsonii TaxID=77094 RepID=A0ACC8XCJ0_9FIRM|nr:galactose/methyl galactoside ABC transporter ATP-binding protein MglA [Epulopiscium sp. SCG-B11WGA-EpuloA1]ONI42726.1 galactose/methyl galactoside ABC transporter ATP-binding protein MglA [Epulopiscium sp. SCG-B05WGA-EpuloA1]
MLNNEYVLEMIDIVKDFPGVRALNKAQLKLRPGTVHALMGENGAGKSTLMKCLFGIYIEDEGEIFLDGKKIHFNNPKQALESGVSMVHQELNQVKETRVMDNIWLGRFPAKGLLVDHKKMYKDTKAILDDLGISIDPKEKVEDIPLSECQMLEIAKAVSYDAKIIVMDEPTSSLTEREVDHLFRIINRLRDKGCAIVYISHKMEEILAISDEVTIMRDGQWVATHFAKDLTTEKIINLMVGRDLTDRFPPKTNTPGDIILDVQDLTTYYAPQVQSASFYLRKGEVLGIAGLVGSRRTELVEALFGVRKKASGTILFHGKQIQNKYPREAIKNGFALLTEDRRKSGIFGVLSIRFNAKIANIKSYTNSLGLLKRKKITKDVKWVIDSMRVKTPSEKTQIRSLSGGNQQKVILGRWLLTEPEILLLDEPTRGIDVGAKYEIYQLIGDLANRDKGVIVISSEMPELIGITDRILVMSNGKVAGIVDTKTTSQEEIMTLAAKYL